MRGAKEKDRDDPAITVVALGHLVLGEKARNYTPISNPEIDYRKMQQAKTRSQQAKTEFELHRVEAKIVLNQPAVVSCPHVDRTAQFSKKETFEKMQAQFCNQHNLDLAHSSVANVAMVYISTIAELHTI